MPTYQIPDIVEVELRKLVLPADVPVDTRLNEKPLSECNQQEVQQAVRAFAALARHTQREIEDLVEKHATLRRRLAHLQAYAENFEELSWVRR
jgi:hypothetical protein